MSYLNFITLQTGAVEKTVDVDRCAIDPAALDLARALRDGSSPVSGHDGYTIKALPSGRCVLCTIYGPAGQPLTTFGIASRSAGAAELWAMLHEQIPAFKRRTDPSRPPQTPWCAVNVWDSMTTDPGEPWRWLAAYELDIAWTFVTRRHRDA